MEKKKDEQLDHPYGVREPIKDYEPDPFAEYISLVAFEGDKVMLYCKDGLWGFFKASCFMKTQEGGSAQCISEEDFKRLGADPEWLYPLDVKDAKNERGELVSVALHTCRLKAKPLPGPDLKWAGIDELDSLKWNPLHEPFKDTLRMALTKSRYVVALGRLPRGYKTWRKNLKNVMDDIEVVFEGECLGIEAYDRYFEAVEDDFLNRTFEDFRLYDEDGNLIEAFTSENHNFKKRWA